MLQFLKNLRRGQKEHQSFTFSRPLVALHSDDWGRVGVRDREGFEWLRSRGLRLGEHPYDLYTLETAEDVTAVAELLQRHRDAAGRSPCLMMNTCTANLDFAKISADGNRRTFFLPLHAGLPGSWLRPHLFEAYRAAIASGVFQPALHGTIHFCEEAVAKVLASNDDRANLVRTLWAAETPYIFWRMPWIGYEYWGADEYHRTFLDLDRQRNLVQRGYQAFSKMFETPPLSACAPGYRANEHTCRAWSEAGIHVAVSGTGEGLRAPHLDEFGILHLFRNIDFEPCQHEPDVEKYLEIARFCFARGFPLVISIHSINFHSTLRDFRTSTLAALDQLLRALKSNHPEMLFVSDEDLYQMVTAGVLADGSTKVQVSYARAWKPSTAQIGAT